MRARIASPCQQGRAEMHVLSVGGWWRVVVVGGCEVDRAGGELGGD